jgi:PAS domain S-box-containing protein
MKLFWKIYAAVFISFVGVVVLISYVTSAKQISDAENRIIDEHIIIGSLISKDIERGQAEAKWPFENLTKVSEQEDFLFWWIVEKDGIIHLADKASFIRTCAYSYFPQLSTITVDGSVVLNRKKGCGIFIKSFGTEKNKRAFWLGFSTSEVSRIKRRIIVSSAASSAFALAALGVMLYLMISHFTRPLKNLAECAAIIGMGELNHRVEVRSEDELGYLAYCFNDMAAKLKESYAHLEEKVQQRTAELASTNTKLEEEVAERRRTQVKLQQRIKQLDCLYGLSRLAVQPQISLDQIFQETTGLIRSAYRYPDITCIRVTFNGIQYKTDNFQKTEHSQWGDILVRGEKAGSIEVYRFEERREDKEGSFLKEEGALLGAVCEKLGRIAELKQATDKLQIFRNLIEQSNEYIFVLEPNWGRFLDVNERACESLGYSRKELLEMSFKDIEEFPEGFSWQQQIEELKLKGDIIIQGRHKCKDGRRFFAETGLKLVKEEKEDYIIAIARDITERKQAEEALRKSEARYKALFTGAPDGMLVADLQTKQFRYANPAICRMFGYTEEEFLRIGVADIHPKEYLDHVLAEFETQSRGEKLLSPDLPCLRKDGTLFYANISGIAMVLDGRKCNVGFFTDVTERKQMEEKLRASEHKYKTLLENLPQKIFYKDKNSVYVSCNENYASDIEIKPEEIAGKTDYDFYPEDLAKKYRADDKRIMESGKSEDIEEKYIQDGQETVVYTVKTPVGDEQGNVIGILGIFWDIMERKRAEQRQAELLKEVESANRELKDFAYIVSHDLKAPLRGVKTLAEWISTDYADKLGEQGKEQIRLLMGRADRMQKLIDGVLEYSRVGRVKENRAVLNLNKVVAEVIDMIAPPENIIITIENELPTIECEPTRIAQVFQNLLSNAVKYMDKPQGQVRIGCVEEDGFWKFSVSDNGPGIEEKHFEKIFQIFQTLAPRDDVESTGVGLTVAKKIVELYGGRIWVQSKVGQGSTFFFTLPKQEVGVGCAKLEANITC